MEFTGKVQRIAQVHQLGLKDRPNPHSRDVQYSERQLLGFSQAERNLVEGLTLAHLRNNTVS